MSGVIDSSSRKRQARSQVHDGPVLPCTFGDYELLEVVSRGAMGVVYRARQISLDRIVAVKMILAGRLASHDQVRRFLTEARAAAKLQHPSIVSVHDVGVQEGRHFFSMEFIESRSLEEIRREGPMATELAVRLMRGVAAAIQYAHEQGVLHRDLKPSNILIDQHGHPWVTDFGLAKALGDDHDLTNTGEPLGTPAYMPPEQAGGWADSAGCEADVYGIGAVLYAMLAGRPPFVTSSVPATLRLVAERDPIPLRILNSNVPTDLETITHKCLRKDPRNRYASAAALAGDLDRLAEGRPILARPIGRVEHLVRRARRHPRTSALVMALFVLFAANVAILVWQWRQAMSHVVALERERQQRTEIQLDALESCSPDSFPALVAQIGLADPETVAHLQQRAHDPLAGRPVRFRAELALLGVGAEQPELIHAGILELYDRPKEFALAVRMLVRSRRSLPVRYKQKLHGLLRDTVEGPDATNTQRFLAAMALASCVPEDQVWLGRLDAIAHELANAGPFYLSAWAEVLRPFPRALLEALAKICVQNDGLSRNNSAALLASCGQHHPDLLVGLLHRVDPDSFRILLSALDGERDRVLSAMRDVLAMPEVLDWPETAVVGEIPVDAPFLKPIRDAHGEVTETFAWFQDLPADLFLSLLEPLRNHGFSPVRIRPHRASQGVRIAAVFARDGTRWAVHWDLSRDDLEDRARQLREQDLIVTDLAAYLVDTDHAEGDGDGEVRYVLSCRRSQAEVVEDRFLAGLPADQHQPDSIALANGGFTPTSCQLVRLADGSFLATSVWWRNTEQREHFLSTGMPVERYSVGPFPGLLQTDVQLLEPRPDELFVSGVWLPGKHLRSREIRASSLDDHRLASRELVDQGFRPQSISILPSVTGEQFSCASVWHRPLESHGAKAGRNRMRSRALATLLACGDMETAWSALSARGEHALRARFLLDTRLLDVSREALADQLFTAADPTLRRTLILALAGSSPRHLDPERRRDLLELIRDSWRTDPDGAVHSACDWFLSRWSQADLEIGGDPLEAPANASWTVDAQGDPMVVIEGPVEFLMGSPGWITGRQPLETPHRRRIDRSYALGIREVTYGQLRQFFAEVPRMNRGHIAADSTPVASLSWYEAVAFCRWLSEKEGLAEAEMCYPPIEQIGPDMVLPADLLSRTGYRLPTEAEWEYACRAGSADPFSFGTDSQLLPMFETDRSHSGSKAAPAGRRIPNEFGLFDMHGNMLEWCQDRFRLYRLPEWGGVLLDEDPEAESSFSGRVVRGGFFDAAPIHMRSGYRRQAPAHGFKLGMGMRLARTVRSGSAGPR